MPIYDNITAVIPFLADEEKIVFLLTMNDVGVLSLRNFTTFNYTIEVKFTILIIFFIIYSNYRNNSELSVDLIKKLKVYYCMNPEQLQRDLEGLIPLNYQLLRNITSDLKAFAMIEEKKEELKKHVRNIELVKSDTERVTPEKINVLDCDILSPRIIAQNTVIYVNKDQLMVISDQKSIVVYGFETKIDSFNKIPATVKTIDFYLIAFFN